MEDLTRRSVLRSGAVAAGALIALPYFGNSSTGATVSVPVGATVNLNPFPAGTTYVQAYSAWTNLMNATPAAAKIYYTENQFPTAPDPDGALAAMLQLGITPVLCYKPAIDGSDQTNLLNSINGLYSSGMTKALVVFYQECNGSNPLTIKQTLDVYMNYYSTVKNANGSFPVLYCPAGYRGPNSMQNYFPASNGKAYCNGIGFDCYCDSGNLEGNLSAAAGLADQYSLPHGVGVLEMGVSASTSRPSEATVKAYIQDAQSFITSRVAANKPMKTPFCWWNGPVTAGAVGMNTLVPTTNNPVNSYIPPVWRTFISQVTGI